MYSLEAFWKSSAAFLYLPRWFWSLAVFQQDSAALLGMPAFLNCTTASSWASIALPSVQLKSQVYPFQSLSAGEKTALLIVTRTMLSSLFSKDVDFLLLDEPLEHLDSRNRHSLLQFLVDALKERLVRQLIVTTTEYSLLRKFIDYQDVRIITLSNLGQT